MALHNGYLRIKYFGHVMREQKCEWARRALLGTFLPTREEGVPRAAWMRFDGSWPDGRHEAYIWDCVYKYGEEVCKIPRWLLVPFAKSKNWEALYYRVTREGFLRATLEYWEKEGGIPAHKVEEGNMVHMKKLGLRNVNLDSWEAIVNGSIC